MGLSGACRGVSCSCDFCCSMWSWDFAYCTSHTMHSSRQSAAIAASSDKLTCSCEICAHMPLPRAAAAAAVAAAATSHASLWMSCEQVMANCTSRASCAALSLARALSASETVTGMLTVMFRSWGMFAVSAVASSAVGAGVVSGRLAITSTCARVPAGIALLYPSVCILSPAAYLATAVCV